MKAIVLRGFGGAENFDAARVPVPALRRGDVRIRVKAISFNPVDCQIRRGGAESRDAPSMILGRDVSGVIDAVGADVRDFEAGDEVFAYVARLGSGGTYAEYVCVPAEIVARKPRTLTHVQAAAVPVAGITATLALDKVRAGAASSLFVAGGAGGVGTFTILLARALGARVVTTAGSPASRAHLESYCGLRPAQVLDYNGGGFVERAIELNAGSFDAAIDLVGRAMVSACCRLVGADGSVASVTEAPSDEDFELLFAKNATFHSIGAHAYSLLDDRLRWRRYRRLLERLAAQFDVGTLPPPAVRVVGPLCASTVREAHALLDAGAVQGKLVMTA